VGSNPTLSQFSTPYNHPATHHVPIHPGEMQCRTSGKQIAIVTGCGGGASGVPQPLFRTGARYHRMRYERDGTRETVEMVRAKGGSMEALYPLDLKDEDALNG